MLTLFSEHTTAPEIVIEGEIWRRSWAGDCRQEGAQIRHVIAFRDAQGLHKGYAPASKVCTVQPGGNRCTCGILFGPAPVYVKEVRS